MKLPVIDRTIYKTTILSRKEDVEFVPFTMKEAKILMMARESKDTESIINALRQILRNCLVNVDNVNDLPLVDLEWLFLNIQAKSSGEVVNLVFKCTNNSPYVMDGVMHDKECGMLIDVPVDLLKVQIVNKDVNTRIMVSETVGIQMKFPTFEATQKALQSEEDSEYMLTALCIDYIFDAESVYQSKDATTEELINFIEQLPQDKYELIENFFENCPTIKETIKKTCSKCNYEHSIELEGLEDFFS